MDALIEMLSHLKKDFSKTVMLCPIKNNLEINLMKTKLEYESAGGGHANIILTTEDNRSAK